MKVRAAGCSSSDWAAPYVHIYTHDGVSPSFDAAGPHIRTRAIVPALDDASYATDELPKKYYQPSRPPLHFTLPFNTRNAPPRNPTPPFYASFPTHETPLLATSPTPPFYASLSTHETPLLFRTHPNPPLHSFIYHNFTTEKGAGELESGHQAPPRCGCGWGPGWGRGRGVGECGGVADAVAGMWCVVGV